MVEAQKSISYIDVKKLMAIQYNRIQEIMDQKGIMQKWLAEKTGIVYSSISRYCRNKAQPNLKQLFKIAEALDVPPIELIGDGKDDGKK